MMYEVTYAGQGAGYKNGDHILIRESCKTINEIAWFINMRAQLIVTDIGLLRGNLDEMTFGARMDGITFPTPVLKVKKVA